MQQQAANSAQERSRLIDHFKRAYQIIVGLAITLACTKLFPNGAFEIPKDTSFWLFCAFFITIVPIFHGGDRSLDIKYLYTQPTGFWGRAAFIWDFYILLITAILFVKIAQAIPSQTPTGQAIPGVAQAPPSTPDHFYQWMAIMLIFDVVALIVDGLKSNLLTTYVKWICLNLVFAIICLSAKSIPEHFPAFSANTVAALVFVAAFLRTVLDYVFGKDFMFP
jgi:hypothetical protein